MQIGEIVNFGDLPLFKVVFICLNDSEILFFRTGTNTAGFLVGQGENIQIVDGLPARFESEERVEIVHICKQVIDESKQL